MKKLPLEILPSLLSNEDNLLDIADELTSAYKNRQIFRTETEARISVLNDINFPTNAAKYWQAIREQTTMLEQLSLLSFDYRRNEVAIKRYKKIIENSTDEFEKEEAIINLEECYFKKSSMKSVASDRVREIYMWSSIKKELADGSFSTTDVNEHQLVSYSVEFLLKAYNTNPESMSVADAQNLQGHLMSSLKRCKEIGVLDKVISNLPKEYGEQVLKITSA